MLPWQGVLARGEARRGTNLWQGVVGNTTGVFDMFDIGHLNILRNASRDCDYLIVGVPTDELAEQKKGRRPMVPFMERMEIVQNVCWVDDVVPQVKTDAMEAWHNLKFDIMFVGDDLKSTDVRNSLEQHLSTWECEPCASHTLSTRRVALSV
jgi:glycerol-3-phosphate cytidylyltransferase